MDLFSAMLAKGVVLFLWGAWADHRDAKKLEKSVLDEQGGCYHASQPLLRLLPPEHTAETL